MRKFLKKHVPSVMHVFNFYARVKYKNRTYNEVFDSIHSNNSWEGDDSLSGQGSDLKQTEAVRVALPKVIHEFGIKSMLDIPCGDHFWMNLVSFDDVQYTGADLVKGLVEYCQNNYSSENKEFKHLDIVKDELGRHDLIFVRDCFVHLSLENIQKALRNIKSSGSKYLITTTFTEKTKNFDIVNGGWRYLNFQLAPFNFPAPLILIDEKCTEGKKFADKSMALWKIEDLPI